MLDFATEVAGNCLFHIDIVLVLVRSLDCSHFGVGAANQCFNEQLLVGAQALDGLVDAISVEFCGRESEAVAKMPEMARHL